MVLRAGVLYREEAGGTSLLFRVENSEIQALNATGTMIVRGLQAGQSLEEIIRAITREYEVTEEVARRDALTLLGRLRMLELIDDSTNDSIQ